MVQNVIATLTDSLDDKLYVKKMGTLDPALDQGWVQLVPTLSIPTPGGLQKHSCATNPPI